MSLIKQLASETAIYGISNVLSKALYWILLTLYLTRILSTYEYGIYADLYAYAALLLVLLTYRLDTALFRFGAEESERSNAFSTAFLTIILTTGLAFVVLYFFRAELARLISYEDDIQYIVWFLLIISFDALAAIPFAKLRLDNKPIKFAFFKILNVLLTILFIASFVHFIPSINAAESLIQKFDFSTVEYVFISNLMASGIILLLLLLKAVKIEFYVDISLWKRMLKYSSPLLVVSIAGLINQSFSVPFLKYFLGHDVATNLEQGGEYAAISKIASILYLFVQAFLFAAEPFFFSKMKRLDAKLIYARIGHIFTIILCFIALAIFFYGKLFLHILGSDFHADFYLLPVLLGANVFLGIYYVFSVWFKVADKTHIGMFIAITGSIITLSLVAYLIPLIGVDGMAYSTLACFFSMSVLCYVLGQKYYPIPYPIFKIIAYLLFAFLLYLIAYKFVNSLESTSIKYLLNTFLLLAFTFVVYVVDRKEIVEIVRMK